MNCNTLNCFSGGLEAETNVFPKSLLATLVLSPKNTLLGEKDGGLLLKRFFDLHKNKNTN